MSHLKKENCWFLERFTLARELQILQVQMYCKCEQTKFLYQKVCIAYCKVVRYVRTLSPICSRQRALKLVHPKKIAFYQVAKQGFCTL